MNHEDHLKFYNEIKNLTTTRFLEDGTVPPIIYCVKGGKIEVYFIASMADINEKNIVEKLMVKLIDSGAEALCFISEIWTLEEKHIHTRNDYPDINNNPNKNEALMLKYSAQGFDLIGMAFIIRKDVDPWSARLSKLGSKPTLGEWKEIKGTQAMHQEGRFCNLWEKARSLHFQEN